MSGVSGPSGLFPAAAAAIQSVPTLTLLQWLGFIPAALGSYLLSSHSQLSRYGWVLFLASNGFWFASGVLSESVPMILQQVVFSATSLRGIYRWMWQRDPVAVES